MSIVENEPEINSNFVSYIINDELANV